MAELPTGRTVAVAGINDPVVSAVTWSAVIAVAIASAAISLIMLILGSGLGLSAVSPWANSGVSATTLGVSAII